MLKSRAMWAVVLLAAANMAWAQQTAPQSAPAPKAPAKTEQPATAAGGQSSGTVVGAETGTIGGASLATIAVVAGAVAAVAVVANNTKSTTSH
jgi:hypothetical protein